MQSTPVPVFRFWYQKPKLWIVIGLLVCGGTLAMPQILRQARAWSAGRKVERANEALLKGEYDAAFLHARAALLASDKNVEAMRVLAKTAEALGLNEALQLRRNAYRVLLTRGREGSIICLPDFMHELDQTYSFLVAAGCVELD